MEYFLVFMFFIVAIFVGWITGSLLIGIITSVLLFVLIGSWDSLVKRFKEKNINAKFIAKCGAIVLGIIIGCSFIFYACIDDSSAHRCLNCGKKGNYSDGYCYRCYKNAENAVKDAYYNYPY